MTNQGWAFNLRSGMALAAFLVAGLPFFRVAPAQANSAASISASNSPSVAELGSATSAPPLSRANAAVAVSVPTLPPLGAPEPFLPTPDEQVIQLVIRLSERRVYVYDREQVITSYPIAIGRSGWETPTGEFEVIQKLSNPTWEHPFTGELVPPGAANPLGSRWIGFWTDGTNYIGFHGTPDADTVGQAASHGCIRMYDQDVQALFEIVQMGTPVVVQP
jgi:L,D-transpeptidase ErfK/SrfK